MQSCVFQNELKRPKLIYPLVSFGIYSYGLPVFPISIIFR